jgi:phenylpropionate dioxygenase-like ring-hydroxylating dioxygenase large terminal subunit
MNLDKNVEACVNQGLLGRWYVVAKSVDVKPDAPLAVKALGRPLVLWRSEDSRLNCVEDRCPHRGAPLSCGRITGSHISCRYHGLTVDGAGAIVSVPALGKSGLEGRKAIAAYAVEEAHDGVFVYFPSAEHPQPVPLVLPVDLVDPANTYFLCAAQWDCNYRYIVENLVDPMHGIYLHGDSFTLAGGTRTDKIEIEQTESGFIVQRAAQRGVNFDWVEIVTDTSFMHARVIIPYPVSGGPGGHMLVVPSVTPLDELHSRIFFWRTRKVSGVEREVWRFLFRTTFEARHWVVLEQDREMLSAMSDSARARELLYQHDGGVVRIRDTLAQQARRQLEAERVSAAAERVAG